MANTAVSFVLQQLYQLAVEEGTLLRGVHRDFQEIKDELESIRAFLKDADSRAADVNGGGDNEGVKAWVKQLRQASFRIEDVIDEYVMYLAQRVNHSGFVASLKKIAQRIKTMKQRHQIASEIQHIKLEVGQIKDRSVKYQFTTESGAESSSGTRMTDKFGDRKKASFFIKDTQVVGFETQRNELVSCLVGGTNELMLVSVVGMGGLGKTTLSKYVFDNKQVKEHFDCRSFITVSPTYNMRELLTNMVKKLCKDNNDSIPEDMQNMDDTSLIKQVRDYLEPKRYLVLFDDVWKENFSDEIEHALISNNNGSRIIVTTRLTNVAEYFGRSFPIHVHQLLPLPENKAWELFCNMAFRGKCPTELEAMSSEIVQICGGLPLAIVTIGGLLSTKPKTTIEWRKVNQNLKMHLKRNNHLTDLIKTLSLSYDDLPYHLKSCMLYFGIYPEDYTIDRKRLTRQWMAEGFVIYEDGRTLEEVSEEYLAELIQRSLVNVSRVGFDGKVKSCQVHDLLREVIIEKMKNLNFCHLIMHKDDEQVTVGQTRRFSIAAISNTVLRNTRNSGIRAIFVFGKDELPEHFMGGLSSKFKLLKVLDFEKSLLNYIPYNLGNLFHLRYLNLSHTKVTVLPRSIGKLVNLETLDLRQTKV
ncbi:NBS-containing resistance-like protein, partial [Trifolium medium]|nr:NBS-containing resistance-like protein [Trifolium medium]